MFGSTISGIFNHSFIFGDNLIPFYQPIVDAEQFIIGYEALGRRYNSKTEHWDSVFSSCKNDEKILELDLIVLEKIIRNVKNGQLDHLKFLSINMTAKFNDANYVKMVNELNQELRLRDIRLQLEVLETQKIEDTETIFEFYNSNISLCLDDFGIEENNIFRLLSIPVDTVKIDRVLFQFSLSSERRFDLLKGIISGLKGNNIKVTCEGIESQQHFDMARKLGCNYFQGYFWSEAFNIN